jgi:hypothetical protein
VTLRSRQSATTSIEQHARQPYLPSGQLPGAPARAIDQPYKPIDIVWSRRRSASGAVMDLEPDARPSRAIGWTAPAPAAPAEPRPVVSRQPLPSAPSVKLTDIDPRLLDRLTDNVIRRVERHVRIERERRGL